MISPFVYRKYAGKVDLINPTKDQIDVRDIVETLANLKRFAGAIPADRAFSVLEHSLAMARCILRGGGKRSPRVRNAARWALWHDAPEAYIGDVAKPVKLAAGDGWLEFEGNFSKQLFDILGMADLYHDMAATADVDHLDSLAVIAEVSRLESIPLYPLLASSLARKYAVPYTDEKQLDLTMLTAEYAILEGERHAPEPPVPGVGLMKLDYQKWLINEFLILNQSLVDYDETKTED